jgi:3-hydroxyacyl-CoA dehydrogenase/enoyl-CoA hydratase/3-hydroxybutyryl-CoA epimerase
VTEQSSINWQKSADGIVVLTLDDPAQSANTMNDRYQQSMEGVVVRLVAEQEDITGVILTSAKKTFFAGGDLRDLVKAGPDDAASVEAFSDGIKAQLRTLETFGRPVVAAINGAALGGGLEIALATHHRIALDARGSQIGLPEVTLGLLPGGGGIVRTVRMLGVKPALTEVLLTGQRYTPIRAKEIGLVDEVVDSPEAMMAAARAWIVAHPGAVQPWDAEGYAIPGGTPASGLLADEVSALAPMLRKQLKGAPMPAPGHILAAAVEGAQVDFASASSIETRYFAALACGQVSKNMIQAFFFDQQAIKAGASRPAGFRKHTARVVGILGAGMMGAGIAYACAAAGMNVRLKDLTLEAAQRGRGHSQRLADRAVGKRAMTRQDADALVERIVATDTVADLADADLIIEAVFEDSRRKHQVYAVLVPLLSTETVIASNTSTLPITGLAEGVAQPERFVGLHFFSPVDRMELVEVIAGRETSDATLAKAIDIVQQLRKIPILVSDSRGFYTSRVIMTRITEAAAMVAEGVAPSSVEQASTQSGYPVGTLALLDELTLTLPLRILGEARQATEAVGGTWRPHPGEAVIARMANEFSRGGRSAGGGFYDYTDGQRFRLWPGLAEAFRQPTGQVPFADVKDRLLFAEAVETVRCRAEGVIRSNADANIGSIYGIGFPAWSGGAAQFVAGYPGGVQAFVDRANQLADRYGERYLPPLNTAGLVARGMNGDPS